MLRIRPSPSPRTDVRLRTRRPPMAYIELLSASEDDFRETVAAIEKEPLFHELSSRGLVKRRGGRGRMTQEAFEERVDHEVAEFVRRHRLDRRRGGLEALAKALSREGVEAVAKRLGASTAEVQRVARFLRVGRATSPVNTDGTGAARSAQGEAPDLADYVAGAESVDTTKATALVADFVHRFGLTQAQLVGDFLHGDLTALDLSRKYHTTEAVTQQVMDAVTFVLTADIVAGPSSPRASRPARERREGLAVVGSVYLRDGQPQLHFGAESGYGLRYVIDPSALAEIETPEKREEAEELVHVLRHINQRRSVQCRVVAALFEKQKAYLASGDELDLVPVSQADLARELKEHQSTISRAVRSRYLDTPHGTHELQFYCQRKQDVVLRLGLAHPDASDRELQQILSEKYGCRIARRTVAYHRQQQR